MGHLDGNRCGRPSPRLRPPGRRGEFPADGRNDPPGASYWGVPAGRERPPAPRRWIGRCGGGGVVADRSPDPDGSGQPFPPPGAWRPNPATARPRRAGRGCPTASARPPPGLVDGGRPVTPTIARPAVGADPIGTTPCAGLPSPSPALPYPRPIPGRCGPHGPLASWPERLPPRPGAPGPHTRLSPVGRDAELAIAHAPAPGPGTRRTRAGRRGAVPGPRVEAWCRAELSRRRPRRSRRRRRCPGRARSAG